MVAINQALARGESARTKKHWDSKGNKMKTIRFSIATIAASILLGFGSASADPFYIPQPVVFTAQDFSVDVFGYHGGREKSGADHDAYGYGVGVNYFITENIGVGAETYADAFTVPYILNLSGIYRFPLAEYNVAPYLFTGLGRQWEHAPQWVFHFGGGAEYRLRQELAGFADLRGVFPVDTDPYIMLRIGIRLRFM